jgi:alpha-tubulin suppressor-like RCC1 family protein
MLAALAACERAGQRDPTQVVEDRLGWVRCRLESGKVACSGDNTWGLIRDPAADERIDAWTTIPIPEKVIAFDLSLMSRFACATGTSGSVYCWGDAAGGKLGNGEAPDWPIEEGETARPRPQRVLGVSDARDVHLGIAHACVLTRGGAVQCWGDGGAGELGRGDDLSPSGHAVKVLDGGVTEIAVTDAQTCARLSSGRVNCWGAAIPVTTGSLQRINTPTELPGVQDAIAVASDGWQMCVSRRSGPRTCWTPMDWPRGVQ